MALTTSLAAKTGAGPIGTAGRTGCATRSVYNPPVRANDLRMNFSPRSKRGPMTTTDAKLAVALVALSKIAHGPSFAGRSSDQMAAKQALDTIEAMAKGASDAQP